MKLLIISGLFILIVGVSALAKWNEDERICKKYALANPDVDEQRARLVAKRLSQIPTDERGQLESELEHLEQLGEQLTPQQNARWCDIYLYLQGESSLNPTNNDGERASTIDELIDEANLLADLLERQVHSQTILARYRQLSFKIDLLSTKYNSEL
ncbi:hypothetical protein OPW41_20460 [Vibrio europaeus]|uniref:Uncharacterized protein n=1 Tax=Vibrio europaeus TaxID=300876 RepID=A0A178JFI8_9VIBR|nr:hypothetical protein [Vibrio europaeus]MDC5707192.1 hypothetical protein [Vibrio europaeus]MDC5712557.1 hypothetical protein [Vibrio europaeus]MDC5717200.1 hypothetical protein [Vibrio europaeus]MDC5721266.1 hypothetical protein [Vibrio europaeus]MDC5726500.1 hypothetical protein [Vibrio europaeus]